MSPADLHKLKAELGNDVAKLEQEVASSDRQHNASLERQDDRLKELRDQRREQQEDFDNDQENYTTKLKEDAEKLDGLVDDATNSSGGAEDKRQTLQSLRSAMRSTLWAARGCDLSKCQALAQLLSAGGVGGAAHRRVATSGRQVNPAGDMVKHEELVREVEALEEKKAKLEDDKQRGIIRYTAGQRAGLDRLDEFERTQRARDVANMKAKHFLDKKGLYLGKQHRAAKRYSEHWSDVQARLEKSTSSLSAKLQNLHAVMGRCKCR